MASPREQARALVAAKMQPMATSPAERKKMDKGMEVTSNPSTKPSYPWGLTLSLDALTMKKLKLKGDLEAGQLVTLTGKAKVTRCEEVKDEDGERCTCTIQITALALVPSRTAKGKTPDKDD